MAMGEKQLRAAAPSVYADNPMPGVSERYKFVRTADILATLGEAGYVVVTARQSIARTDDGHNYAKHMLRLALADHIAKGFTTVGDVVPIVTLTNSHNRTSSFGLDAGLERLICSNGLMSSAGDFTGIRVLHNDPAIHEHILEGAKVIKSITDTVALPMVEKMTKINLPKPLQLEFAQAATMLKWGEERPDHAEKLLEARRDGDVGDDLWRVLNRVQENAMRGGYQARDRGGRLVTTAGIKAVDRDRDFNLSLWTLGAQITEMVA